MILSTPKYCPIDVDVVATVISVVAISALIIVPLAPLESVMVTLLLLKSIASSLIILEPASVEELSVPFNMISPSPVWSSNKNPLITSALSESVPSKISTLPKSSDCNTPPALSPSEFIPSNKINCEPADLFSRYLSNNRLSFSP